VCLRGLDTPYPATLLDREEFESEPQARAVGALWKEGYHTERPHSSLGYKTPAEFSAACARYVSIEASPNESLSTEQPHR
jgi:putative transposase